MSEWMTLRKGESRRILGMIGFNTPIDRQCFDVMLLANEDVNVIVDQRKDNGKLI